LNRLDIRNGCGARRALLIFLVACVHVFAFQPGSIPLLRNLDRLPDSRDHFLSRDFVSSGAPEKSLRKTGKDGLSQPERSDERVTGFGDESPSGGRGGSPAFRLLRFPFVPFLPFVVGFGSGGVGLG
jgi:hypothetical protein